MPSSSSRRTPGRSLVRGLPWPILLSAGFTRAQSSGVGLDAGVGSPSIPACLDAITVTVFPPDYTGIFASLTTLGIPLTSLPPLTLPTPGLESIIGGLSPTGSPDASLPLTIPTIAPSLLGPIVPTPTTRNCGLLGLNCVGTPGSPTSFPLSDLTNLVPGLTSLLGEVLPTNRPLTSALAPLPSALFSIVAGLECDVASLLVGLGIGSGSPVVSSILAGPTRSICPLFSGLLSAASPTLSVPLSIGLPLTTALAPIPSALSSVIAGLPCDVASLLGSLSSSDPIASSILAGPASDICSLLAGLPSTLPSIALPTTGISLPSGLALMTETAVSPHSALSSLLSDLSIPPITLPSTPLATILPSAGSGFLSVLPSVSLSLGLSATFSVPLPTVLQPTISNSLSITGLPLSSPSRSISLPTDLSVSVPTLALPTVSGTISISGVPLPSILSSLSVPPVALPTSSALIPSLSLPLSAPSLSAALTSFAPLVPGGGGNPATNLALSSTPAGSPAAPISSLTLPTSTTFPMFSCPSDQGLTYVSPSGQAFIIHCNTNYPLATPLSSSLQPNLFACANSCGAVPGCTGVTYNAATSTCIYKPNTLGQPADPGIQSSTFSAATPVDLSCPNGDGVYYTDFLGASYQILCNVTFPASANVTSALNLDVGVEVALGERDETAAAAAAAVAARLEARQFAVVSPQHLPILTCSRRCSDMVGCVAVTEQMDQCVFISNLGVSAIGSRIADSAVMIGRRFIDASTGATSTSVMSGANPTQVQSRQASGIDNGFAATTTTMSGLLPPGSLPPIIATLSTSDCGLLGLNCVSGQQPAATPTTSDCGFLGLNCVGGSAGNSQLAPPTSTTAPAVSPASGPAQTAASSTDCGLLGLNCVGGNTGASNPTPALSSSSTRDCGFLGLNCVGGSANPTPVSSAAASSSPIALDTSSPASSPSRTLQTAIVSPVPASSSSRDCGLFGLNCINGGGSPPSMSTVTTRTTTHSQITVTIPVTTITTTSTVSYCNVGPNNFVSCTSSLVVSTATRTSSSSSSSGRPAATTTNCGLFGLSCT